MKKMKNLTNLLPVLALTLVGPVAGAQLALGTANEFNVFVFGDMTVTNGGEAEGAVAVGGTFNMNGGYNVTAKSGTEATLSGLKETNGSTGSLNNVSLYVGNTLNVTSGHVENGGSAYVYNSVSGGSNLDFNGGGSLYTGSPAVYPTGYSYAVDPVVFTNQQSFSLAQSAQLAALSPTLSVGQNYSSGMTMINQNEYDINIAPGTKNTTIYLSVAASFLSGLSNPRIDIQNLDSTDTLVINVTGTSLTNTQFTLQNVADPSYFGNILWNFAGATQIDIENNAFEGSILAPGAAITQNQLIEGNIIAASLNDDGYEQHFTTDSAKFVGNLPTTPTGVPEPGTYALLISMGATGTGLALRRRRAGRRA